MKEIKLLALAEMVVGTLQGDPEMLIHNLADIDNAGQGEITFITTARNSPKIVASKASAIIVPEGVTSAEKSIICVNDPNLAAAIIHNYFCAEPFKAKGVSPAAYIGADCDISSEITVGPHAVVGDRVHLGNRVTIEAGVVLGDDVVIGDDTVLHANVTIAHGCKIGKRVIVHSGVVIGGDGFGYATDEHGNHIKRPQVGIVEIEDDVEIGANTTIDRATFGRTLIKKGVKIDNLVMIGHNVQIGEGSILVGQVGIGGSTTIGRGVILAGQVAVKDHLQIGDRVVAAGRSGVHESLPDGAVVSGMPAIPHGKWLRATAIFPKLPELVKEIRDLKKTVSALADKLKNSGR